MLNENAKKWVDALRSGEYKQVHLALCQNKTYCCLGVACDLYLKENPKGLSIRKNCGTVFYHGRSMNLPERVRDWLGLSNNGGGLADKNDTGVSFSDIADFIESEPKGLFV